MLSALLPGRASRQNGRAAELEPLRTGAGDNRELHKEVRVHPGVSPRSVSPQVSPKDKPKAANAPGVCVGDVVQFSTEIYYASEKSKVLEIDIIRIGPCEGQCSVSYQTEEGSARAGEKYEHTSGTVTFQHGQAVQPISVKIIDDDIWDTTLEFMVTLSHPDGCTLGRYLRICRVKIMDNDIFPTNHYRQEMLVQKVPIENISGPGLMWQFCIRIFMVRGLRRRTIVYLALDQIHNLQFFVATYLGIFMVDVLFEGMRSEGEEGEEGEVAEEGLVGEEGEGGIEEAQAKLLTDLMGRLPRFTDRTQQAAIYLAVFYVILITMQYLADFVKMHLNLNGYAEEFLRQNLFRKYLNFDESTRTKIAASEMALVVVKETQETVEFGYMKVLALSRILGKTCLMCLFIYIEQKNALYAFAAFPVLMGILLAVKMHSFIELGEEVVHHEIAVAHHVHETSRCIRLVMDYHQRPKVMDSFKIHTEDLSLRKLPFKLSVLNSDYYAPCIATFFMAGYIVLFSKDVRTGHVSLGTFLAMIKILQEAGLEFKESFTDIMEITHSIGALRKLTSCLNGATDLEQRASANCAALELMKQRRAQDGFDDVPMSFTNILFRYSGADADSWSLVAQSLGATQGKLIAVVGHHKAGKSTFMKILGGVLAPQMGQVFIPPHLRVLHVSQDPMILDASLWENLTFGCHEPNEERVKRILEQLERSIREQEPPTKEDYSGIKPVHLLERLECERRGDKAEPGWQRGLSTTDQATIHLVRALMYNPEVMVIHRPGLYYSDNVGKMIIQVLREYVRNRGLHMDGSGYSRRPRTCFYSCDDDGLELAADVADSVWEVSHGQVTEKSRKEG